MDMSDTPRTDACYGNSTEQGELFDKLDTLARTLERELTAVTAERDRLRAALEIAGKALTHCAHVMNGSGQQNLSPIDHALATIAALGKEQA